MRILAISDEPSSQLWGSRCRDLLADVDLILSAGDLPSSYLSFLTCFSSAPIVYVHGNHVDHYAQKPPEGCLCADGKILQVRGVRILGLGGSPLYSGGEWQFSERQMVRRIRRLRWRIARAGGVDIVLTHAPIREVGDQEDPAHRGFEAFRPLLEKWKPRYLVHGHVHKSYGADFRRVRNYADTTVINACGRYWLEIK